jgi:hypothetical protein
MQLLCRVLVVTSSHCHILRGGSKYEIYIHTLLKLSVVQLELDPFAY